MTPDQLEAIQRTVTAIERAPDRFARRFYDGLFDLSPEVRELFPDDLAEQRGKLVDEVVFLAGAASDLAGFTTRARDLGARHRGYGVRSAHYPLVEQALLAALAETMGDDWTPEVAGAWRSLYHLVAETMAEGASGALFADDRAPARSSGRASASEPHGDGARAERAGGAAPRVDG